jgi:hypothetical protein
MYRISHTQNKRPHDQPKLTIAAFAIQMEDSVPDEIILTPYY